MVSKLVFFSSVDSLSLLISFNIMCSNFLQQMGIDALEQLIRAHLNGRGLLLPSR
jgi:hypothetical protein